jgi:molybdopterin-guanine dinucleotide biosynthesis protein A
MLTVILTGGASRRMGRDKAMLPMDGQTMALLLAQRYEALGPVAFSVNRAGRFPVESYQELVDAYPGCGPLNGIVSAFCQTQEDVVFLTATDMPAGDVAAVRALLEGLWGYDACIYGNEPLFGVYHRRCLDMALDCLENGQYAFREFLQKIKLHRLDTPRQELFTNLNTPEEYRAFVQEHC